jgi:hypothetical protein
MSLHDAPLTPEFCERWKELLRRLYGYRFDGPFAVVPTLTGQRVLSHLPLLSYTALRPTEAEGLARQAGSRPYQIRVLNPDYRDFRKNDTVTMRVDLRKESLDAVHAGIATRTRRYLRDVERQDFALRTGNDSRLVRDFYCAFSDVMHRLGTPVFALRLFELLAELLHARYYVVYRGDKVAAAAVTVHDQEIAWVPWSGTAAAFLEFRPGLLMYWRAIQEAYAAGKAIFDYGRSGYESGTYEFKTRWGAIPVKIDTLTPRSEDVYSKYKLASDIWKRLPRRAADCIGPFLCRYLTDL